MSNATPEELRQRVIANRRHAINVTSTPPVVSAATLRTASTPNSGESICATCGGVRRSVQRSAASLSDAPPPPPDVAARIRANREREKQHTHPSGRQPITPARDRHAQVAEQVRAEMRAGIRPTTDVVRVEYASRTAEANDVPPPPSVIDRILRNRGAK
jgi:hypothetical protein